MKELKFASSTIYLLEVHKIKIICPFNILFVLMHCNLTVTTTTITLTQTNLIILRSTEFFRGERLIYKYGQMSWYKLSS